MDFVDDFFDLSKSLVRYKIPDAQVGGDLNTEVEVMNTYYKDNTAVVDPESEFDYVEDIKVKEEIQYLENHVLCTEGSQMLDVEGADGVDDSIRQSVNDVYKKYRFDYYSSKNLSINSYQEEITDLIKSNSVVVIQGPTGCGKTTQVPQFILDYCQSNNKYCNIAVTQPRRIAAISVARRVAEERVWPVGSVVGYQVGLDCKSTAETLLTYMTTGVLLQKLITMKNMNKYTHIILDEVHERDQEMDFLLLVVRRYLRTVSPLTRVVLMSATFDVDHFASYFLVPRGLILEKAPIIDITKTQPYPVDIFYLDQFKELLESKCVPNFLKDEPTYYQELKPVVLKLIRVFNTFDASTVGKKCGSILIFLPGIFEIEDVYEMLVKENKGPVEWFIVPLHSSVTIEEQRKAFEEPKPGFRKIILSTNIAESSITVPDVVYVIDLCLTRVLMCDSATNYSSLKLMWASHTNCEQRAGRVGRVSAGKVYRLVSEQFYYDEMERRVIPELLRSPLHRLVLLSKMLEMDLAPHEILALAIDPPAITNIVQTIALLKEAGALLPTCRNVYSNRDGDLTYMGRIMARLPLAINVSKLIILGHLFSTLKECIIMAAAMSLQNIFSSPFNERMKSYTTKLHWADCSRSDLIAYLHVYLVWDRHRNSNLYRCSNAENTWMKRNFLQQRIMKEWRTLILDIKQRLEGVGIVEPTSGMAANLCEHEKAMILKVVISGAFYPNYFVRSNEGGQIDEYAAVKQLGGRNPCTTVYFSGKPNLQPAELYSKFIRDMLSSCGQHIQISYDSSSKIYVQFKHEMIQNNQVNGGNALVSGKVALEVYNAVKYRHLKLPTSIPCLTPAVANKRIEYWKQEQALKKNSEASSSSVPINVLPSMETIMLELNICFANNPGHFFAHNMGDPQVTESLCNIQTTLNGEQLEEVTDDVVVGKVYAAPYEGSHYRAKVVYLIPGQNKNMRMQVIFIDYGNMESVNISELRKLPAPLQEIPPLALECVLANVQPSHEKNPHALWTKEATEEFLTLTCDGTVYGKVYSVVESIVSLELYVNTPTVSFTDKTINHMLVEMGLAEPTTESFLSQDDHKKREYVQNSQTEATFYTGTIEWIDKDNEPPQPSREECRYTMYLKGPYSPLEMQIFSVIQCGISKGVCIDNTSVNSVLLDTDPQDPHDRLLVAGSVNQNVDGSKLLLRHTTIMPNIHGFSVLMAMIFCPRMNVHTNKEGSRITSILCGLGCDPNTNASYFPQHDLALNLDLEITEEYLTQVNEIRYFMNNAIQALSCYKTDIRPHIAIENCQNEIRKRIRELLKRSHETIEREILSTVFLWNNLPADVLVTVPSFAADNEIWPMHSFVKLKDHKKTEISRNLLQLQDFATKTISLTEITCNLCNTTSSDITYMRVHLMSAEHLANVEKFQNEV